MVASNNNIIKDDSTYDINNNTPAMMFTRLQNFLRVRDSSIAPLVVVTRQNLYLELGTAPI